MIYNNGGGLGIQLGPFSIVDIPNDPGDADTGPNNLQNFPGPLDGDRQRRDPGPRHAEQHAQHHLHPRLLCQRPRQGEWRGLRPGPVLSGLGHRDHRRLRQRQLQRHRPRGDDPGRVDQRHGHRPGWQHLRVLPGCAGDQGEYHHITHLLGQPLVSRPAGHSSRPHVGAVAPTSGVPTGTVTFMDGPTAIDTATLSGGSASFTTSSLVLGNHTITVVYDGDADFQGSVSTALTQTIIPPSILILNPTASGALTLSGNASVNIPGAVVVDSSSSTALSATGNAQLTASVIDVAGGFQRSGNATFNPAPTTGVSVPDPLAGLAGTEHDRPDQLWLRSASAGSSHATIGPGHLQPDHRLGQRQPDPESRHLHHRGRRLHRDRQRQRQRLGVMIYNAGSNYPNSGGNFGGITLSGNGTFNLTAPTTGPYAGILIFQSRQNTRALSFSGNAMAGMSGTIYAANALLSMSGNSSLQNPLDVGMLNLSGNVALTQTRRGATARATPRGIANTLLAGDLSVYINDPRRGCSPPTSWRGSRTRSTPGTPSWSPYNVTITEVSDPTLANIVIDTGTTSACGGAADGVLGCFNDAERARSRWSRAGTGTPGPTRARSAPDQYDFETTVLHELGHALGLGGSTDPSSPMYETLAAGVADRTVTTQDLNIPDPPDGADPQMAAGFRPTALSVVRPLSLRARRRPWRLTGGAA